MADVLAKEGLKAIRTKLFCALDSSAFVSGKLEADNKGTLFVRHPKPSNIQNSRNMYCTTPYPTRILNSGYTTLPCTNTH